MTQAEPGELFILRNAGNMVPPNGWKALLHPEEVLPAVKEWKQEVFGKARHGPTEFGDRSFYVFNLSLFLPAYSF